jgi:SAM-dependent methyltransferase
VPFAARFPESRAVGIDLATIQIERARSLAAAAGAANVDWRAGDFRALADDGPFDYVIAHGVFSWIGVEAAAALLELVRRRLAPRGVAYVSYNVKPGWALRGMVRDAMLFHTRDFAEPAAKVREARALLAFLARAALPDEATYAAALREEMERLSKMDDAYLFHEHLELENRAYYFYEFAALLAEHGLAFLAETPLGANSAFAVKLPPPARQALAALSGDRLRREQIYDLVRNRMFRQSLVVHAGALPAPRFEVARARGLHVALATATRRADGETVDFGDGGKLRLAPPAYRAAFEVLEAAAPASLPWVEAAARGGKGEGMEQALFDLWAVGVADAAPLPIPYSAPPGDRPAAPPLVRYQAKGAGPVTNLRHESIAVTPLERRLLARLDGSMDRAALHAALRSDFAAGVLVRRTGGAAPGSDTARDLDDLIAERLERGLLRLAGRHVLVGPA